MKQDLIGPEYYSDPYYQTEAYKQKLQLALKQEQFRQQLMSGQNTPGTQAYARYLLAVENDATMSHGSFKPFKMPDDQEVHRAFPHLKENK